MVVVEALLGVWVLGLVMVGLVGLVVGCSLDQKNRPSLEGFMRVVRKFWICVRVGVSAADSWVVVWW